MAYNIIVKAEAHTDILEAYLYYEELKTGLGEKLIECLLQRYEDLKNNPYYYSYIQNDPNQILRDVKLDIFPYLIVYEISVEDVIIYSLHNTHRDPSAIKKK
jgi:hypothetical protein